MVIKKPWPSTMRTVYGDHARFECTYFEKFPGYYLTGDGMCSLIIQGFIQELFLEREKILESKSSHD